MADDIMRVPASEQLRNIAQQEREGKLIPINEYKPESSEYSATHPNALSDGDEKGKGLKETTIGSETDIQTRKTLRVINQFSEFKPYTYPE